MVIEISVAVIALSVFLLSIYLIFFLKDFMHTIRNLDDFLDEIKPHLSDLLEETSQLSRSSNHIVTDLQKKLEAVDPFVKSISNVGEGLEKHTSLHKKRSELENLLQEEAHISKKEKRIYTIVDLIELGIVFWQTLKKRS